MEATPTPNLQSNLNVGTSPATAGTAPSIASTDINHGNNQPLTPGHELEQQSNNTVEDLNEGDGHKDLMEGDGVEDFKEGASDDGNQPETAVWGKSRWGMSRWAGGDSASNRQDATVDAGKGTLNIEGYAPSVIATSTVVKQVRQNPALYLAISKGFLSLLENVESGELRTSSNEDPITGQADRPEDLVEALREIRDELRRLNDLLEKDLNSPLLESQTESVRSALLKMFKVGGVSFAGVFGGLLAPVVLVYGLQFLQELGVPEMDPKIIEQIKEVSEIVEKAKSKD